MTKNGCPRELYPDYYEDFIKVKNAVMSAELSFNLLILGRIAPQRIVKKNMDNSMG
jgi:hypothetical protein